MGRLRGASQPGRYCPPGLVQVAVRRGALLRPHPCGRAARVTTPPTVVHGHQLFQSTDSLEAEFTSRVATRFVVVIAHCAPLRSSISVHPAPAHVCRSLCPVLTQRLRAQGRLEFTNPGSSYPQLSSENPAVWSTSTCAPAPCRPAGEPPSPPFWGNAPYRSPAPPTSLSPGLFICYAILCATVSVLVLLRQDSLRVRCVCARVRALNGADTAPPPLFAQFPLGMLAGSLFLRTLEFYSLSRAFAVCCWRPCPPGHVLRQRRLVGQVS